MSSIRPLITITILVVVGVFLFTKINEGPADDGPPAGIPALATSGAGGGSATLTPATPAGSSSPAENTAPQWAGSVADPTGVAAPAIDLPPTATTDQTTANDSNLPNLPAIPDLPSLGPLNPTIELPANIPTASYPDQSTAADASRFGSAPPPSTATSPPSAVTSMPTISSDATSSMPTFGTGATTSMPIMSSPMHDVHDAHNANQLAPILTDESSDSFAASWPAIQTALARQELTQAHQMLSEWYGNPTLTPSETQQVESLLGQLAGTVVYSTDHRLESPYVVRTGDTLESIAEKYEVPWQLLAKINGIPSADLVQPGRELKVIRGPFTAIIELGKRQLTLGLDGRYAGRFPITVEPDAANHTGQWVLEQKLTNPSAGATDRVLVLRNSSPLAAGETISITSGPSTPSGPTAVAPPAVRLSARDAEELSDILSVGSRVVIRR